MDRRDWTRWTGTSDGVMSLREGMCPQSGEDRTECVLIFCVEMSVELPLKGNLFFWDRWKNFLGLGLLKKRMYSVKGTLSNSSDYNLVYLYLLGIQALLTDSLGTNPCLFLRRLFIFYNTRKELTKITFTLTISVELRMPLIRESKITPSTHTTRSY